MKVSCWDYSSKFNKITFQTNPPPNKNETKLHKVKLSRLYHPIAYTNPSKNKTRALRMSIKQPRSEQRSSIQSLHAPIVCNRLVDQKTIKRGQFTYWKRLYIPHLRRHFPKLRRVGNNPGELGRFHFRAAGTFARPWFHRPAIREAGEHRRKRKRGNEIWTSADVLDKSRAVSRGQCTRSARGKCACLCCG